MGKISYRDCYYYHPNGDCLESAQLDEHSYHCSYKCCRRDNCPMFRDKDDNIYNNYE